LAVPAPNALIMAFGETAIELELRFWIEDAQNGVHNVKSQGHRQLVRSGYSEAGEYQWTLGFIANPYYRFRPRPEIFVSSKLYALRQ